MGVEAIIILSFLINSVYVEQVKETIFCTLISLIASFDKINEIKYFLSLLRCPLPSYYFP